MIFVYSTLSDKKRKKMRLRDDLFCSVQANTRIPTYLYCCMLLSSLCTHPLPDRKSCPEAWYVGEIRFSWFGSCLRFFWRVQKLNYVLSLFKKAFTTEVQFVHIYVCIYRVGGR